MPKARAEIDPEAKDTPFYFVRIDPKLFADVEACRVALGYNKRKSVEVMAEMFLTLKPEALKKKKPTKKKK